MPSKSKQQQKFMGIVRSIQKGEEPAGKFSKAAQKAAKSMKKSSVRKYAKTKHDDLPKKVKEEKKRDYKDEYKKFQSSSKMKKYRAELNKYNRKKGTYGNGDGKDASHKGGKIVGFEAQSKNRGRAEKSRLKKESIIVENPAAIAAGVRAAMDRAKERELKSPGGKSVKVATALANKKHPQHKKAKGIIDKIKDKAKQMLSKSKSKSASKPQPKKQSKGDMDYYKRQFNIENKVIEINGVKYKPVEEGFGGELKGSKKKKFEKARKENAEQLGYKLTGKSDVNESLNERSNPSDKKELLRALKNSKVADAFSLNNDELVIEMTSPSGTNFVVGNIRKYKN